MPAPFAALLTLAAGFALGIWLAGSVQRRRLNEATHELRRPLQALALAPAAEGAELWLEHAAAALAELDRRINGGVRPAHRAPTEARTLLEQARRRWSAVDRVRFRPVAGGESVPGDPLALAAALDNLIANALEHGDGPVEVESDGQGAGLRLLVSNRVSEARTVSGPRRPADRRRGHGLRVAAEIVARHGGRLEPPIAGAGPVTAALELPVAAER